MTENKGFFAVNPQTNEKIFKEFFNATTDKIDKTVKKTSEAFEEYSLTSRKIRKRLLYGIAEGIENLGDSLIETCNLETGLPKERLIGERLRTVNQLRMFGDYILNPSYLDIIIDTPKVEGKPDLRQMLIPIGPVAIFGSSNFPLAFSTAGGDTASALASGSTVIFKAHPAHPNTSELIYKAITKTVEKLNLPEGVFAMIQGGENRVGEDLVKHPLIKSVTFTGSFYGGRALFDLVSNRKEPIPVFAEMGSINPVFIVGNSLVNGDENFVSGLVDSFTMGSGQFCTNPGILITVKSELSERILKLIEKEIQKRTAATMLTNKINNSYIDGIKRLKTKPSMKLVAIGQDGITVNQGIPHFFKTTAKEFIKDNELQEECFGPISINVIAEDYNEMNELARHLKGQLTASLFGKVKDMEKSEELVRILKNKAGRILFNNFPTGVEVNNAIFHGGPYPATTDSRFTSVGTNAIKRFLRPVAFQNYPENLLPVELQNKNKLGIYRKINGELSKKDITL